MILNIITGETYLNIKIRSTIFLPYSRVIFITYHLSLSKIEHEYEKSSGRTPFKN